MQTADMVIETPIRDALPNSGNTTLNEIRNLAIIINTDFRFTSMTISINHRGFTNSNRLLDINMLQPVCTMQHL